MRYLLVIMSILFPFTAFSQVCVGSTDYDFEVTPTGQLTLSVPIKLPPGTGGVEPKLSVSYNGSTRRGLCGVGFDLEGLSIINRTPANLYNDYFTGAVEVCDSDRLMLDGQRLIKAWDMPGGKAEYHTEHNDFSRIIAEVSDSLGPTAFTVTTKSGLTYYYDALSSPHVNRTDAAGGHGQYFLFWLLRRVTDSTGNYFTVTYGTDNDNGEYWPERIDYTGNDNGLLSPYNSVRFSYIENPDSVISYVGGVKVKTSRLLSRIESYYGDNASKFYTFSYESNGESRVLHEIDEYTMGTDGAFYHYNPIRFEWCGDEPNLNNHTFHSTDYVRKSTITTLDFNGDGFTDMLVTPRDENAGWMGWNLFRGTSSGLEYHSSGTFSSTTKVEQVVTGDFNGDGKDDAIIKRKISSNYHISDLYVGSNTILGLSQNMVIKTEPENNDYDLYRVEITGDGIADLLICNKGGTTGEARYSKFEFGVIYPLACVRSVSCPNGWGLVRILDLDGSGLSDVANLHNNQLVFLKSDRNGFVTRNVTNASGNDCDDLIVGDFNGDGKSDLIFYYNLPFDTSGAKLKLSTGHDALKQVKLWSGVTPFQDHVTMAADIDGDGRDDLCLFKTSGSGPVSQVLYSRKGGTDFTQDDFWGAYGADKWNFTLGDFNGDGRADMVCSANTTGSDWSGYWLYVGDSPFKNRLMSITDGMGNTTTASYGIMTDAAVHTKGNSHNYPLQSFSAPWPLVSHIVVPNGLGGCDTTRYHYHNAILHKKGRGVLGFKRVSQHDVTRNTTKTSEWEINEDVWAMALKRDSTKVNGRLVETNLYTNFLSRPSIYGYPNYYVFTLDPMSSTSRSFEYNTGEQTVAVTTEQTRDDYGNVTWMRTDNGALVTTTVNSYLNDTENWYLGRLTQTVVTRATSQDTIVNRNDYTYYPTTGLLKEEIVEPGNRQIGYTKRYTRDFWGNIITSTTIPNDSTQATRTTHTLYDQKARLVVRTTDALGDTTHFNYLEKTGALVSSIDANGITTVYRNHNCGNFVQTLTPVDTVTTTTEWCQTGDYTYKTTKTQTGKPVVEQYYNSLGQLLLEKTQTAKLQKLCVEYEYNTKGQRVSTSNPYFENATNLCYTTHEYDPMGRVTKTTGPGNDETTYQYDGLTTTTTDPHGRHTTKTLDVNGCLVESVDDNGTTVTFDYNAAGKCVKATGPRTAITVQFDILGNRTSLNDPDLGEITYGYNAFGEMAWQNDNGRQTTWQRDALGRVTREIRPDVTITNTYDTWWRGALSVTTASNGTATDYYYDVYGRPTIITDTVAGRALCVMYHYNNQNQIDRITYPNGFSVKRYYNNGYLVSVNDPTTNASYWCVGEIDSWNRMQEAYLGNGLRLLTCREQARDVISSIYARRQDNTNLVSLSYEVDEVGNLIARDDNIHNLHETFGYDNMDRLVWTETNGIVKQQMSYDSSGNLTSKTGVGTHFNYRDNSNQLTKIYGANYNPRRWNDISYSSFHKITRIVSNGDSLNLLYGPDQARRRAVTTKNSVVTTHYYAFGGMYEEIVQGDTIRQVCHLSGGQHVFAFVERKGTQNNIATASFMTTYLVRDHLGSVVGYLDAQGALVQELSYDAWGRRRNPATWEYYPALADAAPRHDRGFTGHEHIDLFDMVNMDGRIYDPVLGRFLSPDPLMQLPDFAMGLNRYLYCLDNPLSLTDPSGYSWFSKHWKTLLGIVGIGAAIVVAATGNVGAGVALGKIGTGALFGAATSALTYSVSALATAKWSWSSLWKTMLMGSVSGAIGGLFSCGTGNFARSFEYGLLSATTNSIVTNALFGGQFRLQDFAGIMTSATLLAGLPRFTARYSKPFVNGLAEGGYNSLRGALSGTVTGGMRAASSHNIKHLWQGMAGGAASGFARSAFMDIVFGFPQNREIFTQTPGREILYRSGGLGTFFFPNSGHGLTLGYNLYVSDLNNTQSLEHEFGHYVQVNDPHYDYGASRFYVPILYQYLRYGINKSPLEQNINDYYEHYIKFHLQQ